MNDTGRWVLVWEPLREPSSAGWGPQPSWANDAFPAANSGDVMFGGGGRGLVFIPAGCLLGCCSQALELSGFCRAVLPKGALPTVGMRMSERIS